MRKISLMILMAALIIPTAAYADNHGRSSRGSKAKVEKNDSKKDVGNDKTQAEKKADAPIVKFTDEQIMLNNQAVDAGKAGDYDKAEQLLSAMLQINEMNIIWANLGGVYAKQGKCLEAEDAFKKVWTSPKISEMPAESIEASTRVLMKKLKQQCSADVTLKCMPADMKVKIDGGKEFKCHDKVLSLTPGRHSVYAETSYGINTVMLNAVANQTTTVPVEVIDYERVAVDAGITPEEIKRKSTIFKAVGYTFLGVGLGVGAGGAALLAVSYTDYNNIKGVYEKNPGADEQLKVDKAYNDTVPKLNASYGMIAVGSALLVTGIVLVTYDAVKYQPKLDEFEKRNAVSSLSFSPTVSPEFTGFSLSGRF